MKRLVLLVSLLTLCARTNAQGDLIPNGSFEDVINCPDYFGNLMASYCQFWNTPGIGSPDYFHECGLYEFQTPPSVIYGRQWPLSGEAFVGAYFFQANQPEGREYAQVKLNEPVHADTRYRVSFYVSLSELSRYAISSIGAHLSYQPLTQSEYWVLDVEPQIQNPAGNIITDTSGWVLITDTFASRTGGGEEWLTIGNFNYAAESDTFAFQPSNPDMGGFFFSYYYIDDVSVVALDSVPSSVDETETVGLTVYPNPASQFVQVHSHLPIHSIRLVDVRGREITVKSNVGGHRHSLDVSGLPAGMYLLEAKDKEGRRAMERIVKADGP